MGFSLKNNPLTNFVTNRYFNPTSAAGPVQPGGIGQIAKDLGVAGAIYGIINPNDSSGLAKFFGTGGQQQPTGYQGGIPNYTASRQLAPNAFSQTYPSPDTGELTTRRPGSGGRRYFTDTQFTQSTDEPFMGVTAEDIAARNAAAQAELDLFKNILGGVETETAANKAAADKAAADKAIADAAAAKAANDAANAAAASAATKNANDMAYNSFIAQFSGDLTAADAAKIAASSYPIDKIAASFNYDAEELQDFIDYYTDPVNLVTPSADDTTVETPSADDTTVETTVETPFDYSIIRDQTADALVAQAGFTKNDDGTLNSKEGQIYTWNNTTGQFVPVFSQGGLTSIASKGMYLGGTTDGMADEIPATIDNNQPAALSDGEFVIPADVVSHLGNGNSDAGAKNLYSMMDRVRTDRTGNPEQGRQIDPNKYLA